MQEINYTEQGLIELCQAVSKLERAGKKFCVDYGYENAVIEAKGLLQTNISHDFKSAIAAVDIACVNSTNKIILLGRKSNALKYRFIGGFVDEKDKSYLAAARREFLEEAPNIEASNFEYLGSLRINDPRYENDRCKIFTTLFLTEFIYGNTKAGDDLEQLEWFPIAEATAKFIVDEHQELWRLFLDSTDYIWAKPNIED